MDHDFAELEFFAFLAVADVLCDDGSTIHVAVCERRTAGIAIGVPFVLVVIESADVSRLANSAVSLRTSAVVLPAEVEGLEEKHNRDLSDGEE